MAVGDFVLAMTGASGAPYGVRLLVVLVRAGRTVHLVISPAGAEVIFTELDRRLSEGAAEVHVHHGHGSGALKSAIREHLARSPYVRRARPGESHEGGDAVTVAEL